MEEHQGGMAVAWVLLDFLTICAAGSFGVEELQQVTLTGCLTVDVASMQALQIFKVIFLCGPTPAAA